MAITERFKSAAEAKDITLVRIMIKDSMVVDPTLADCNLMIKMANSKFEGLFDAHDGEVLNYDKSAWTKDYMDEQMVQIVFNFSTERLELLKDICQFLYKDRATKASSEQKSGSSSTVQIDQKHVGGLIVAVVVVAVVVGVVLILRDK